MRKQLLSLILILIMLLTVLTGCAGKSEPPAADDTGQTVSQVDTGSGKTELPTTTEAGSETTATEETTSTATTESETEESAPSEETTKTETKPTEPSVSTTPKEETTTPPTQTDKPVTTEPPTQPTEEPEESQPPVQTQPPATTEPTTTPQPPETTEPPEVTEPEQPTFTEADHNRIISEVKAYAEGYAAKGFAFQWKESMTFGWDVGYMGTPRIERDGIDGVIELLKYHVDLIYKTSTDPAYGVTTTVMTYKVEQITVDGDLAYVVIYGG